ncbi:pseudouridine synthase [Trichococcus ilyis]|uniref:Pseudouridine synthase n=1 Tax=Trichococcus ilyis TaxID=640938 RepID=A0A143YTI6_9LACT|nr:pseudouridine synthase [Trichococcus ilyis]CZQ98228.1 pseudouridine synthase rsua/rlub/c/d/e/f [Trichococcus ilyis]SEJ18214.1 16S rRNA pseudouridine516 synthase [Trichococcus ilyis]
MRLDKLLANSGFGSRKEVKLLLKKKWVTVNGKVETKAEAKVDSEKDIILVGDEPVSYQEYLYLMMNKPQGVLSATEDNHQKTVIDLLSFDLHQQELFPVGRLDKDTEGLLLLTNDGQLAHFLLSPKRHVDKVYFARVAGRMTEDDRIAFADGIVLEDGYRCLPAKLELRSYDEKKDVSEVEITIKEGKFHQVKRMVVACGKEVTFLKRLTMGPLRLDENLEKGEYRPLREEEIAVLRAHLPESIKKG